MTTLRVIYILAIGILLITLVSVGIWAFYEGPTSGDYGYGQAYDAAREVYHRNVLIIAYVIGLLFVTLGLLLKEKLNVMRSGLLLGGLMTMIYALAQGAGSLSRAGLFIAIAVGGVVLIVLGYIKLVPRGEPDKSRAKGEDVQD